MMTKPFDVANLKERLKAKGLDVAEELLAVLAGETLDWTKESLEIHESPYIKFLAPVVASVKPVVMKEIDKVDGQVG